MSVFSLPEIIHEKPAALIGENGVVAGVVKQAGVGEGAGAVGHFAGAHGEPLLTEGRGGRQALLQQRRRQRYKLAVH